MTGVPPLLTTICSGRPPVRQSGCSTPPSIAFSKVTRIGVSSREVITPALVRRAQAGRRQVRQVRGAVTV